MAVSYCGKDCTVCTEKEEMNCPGCKLGPGKFQSNDCEIAKCCRENGHMSCDTCTHSRNYCATYNTRNSAAQHRKKLQLQIQERQHRTQRRAIVMGKWLWIWFWVSIAANAVSLFSTDLLGSVMPILGIVSGIVNGLLSIAVVLILFKISAENSAYRTGAICMLVCAVMNLVTAFFDQSINGTVLDLLLSIPITVAGLLGYYKIYTAHSEILIGVYDTLSERWVKLWKWRVRLPLLSIASIVVTFVVPMLGLLLALAVATGGVVLGIVELVCLYRTAAAFRELTYGLQA